MWLVLVPIWHFPDEQSHFGQVAFLSETGRNPKDEELDLTDEIYSSERLLGTERDNFGNNKFTFHPEYKIEYTDSLVGKYEASIAALSKTGAKSTFVDREAARYPPLYYIFSSIVYKLFYQQDLFTRVFAVRFCSLVLFLLNVYIAYKIGLLLFENNKLLSSTLTILVGFQPMMVFSNVGVNSDSLGNLLFTAFLFINLSIISSGISKKRLLILSIISLLTINTKPQFIIILPSVFMLLFFTFFRDSKLKHKYQLSFLILLIFLFFFYLLYYFRISSLIIIDRFLASFDLASLIKFTFEYTIPHTIREVLHWYWGVYDWLGVTYPRVIHRMINRIVVIAFFGFGYWLFRNFKEKKWRDNIFQGVIFLIFVNILYFLAVSVYDWWLWYTSHYQLGVQGRYFFPLISVHMLILIVGWQSIFPNKWRLKLWGTKILGILMITLNLYAVYIVAKTYYDFPPFLTLVIQASQYKPWFFKGIFLIGLWSVFLITLVKFLSEYIRHRDKKRINIDK